MNHSAPQYATYVVVNAHTDQVVSTHDTRADAKAAKAAAGDHALRVRGGKPLRLSEAVSLGGIDLLLARLGALFGKAGSR